MACGHCAPYRDGVRYCASCAGSLPVAVAACNGCGRENFVGDRFCAFCAVPLPGARNLVQEGGEVHVAEDVATDFTRELAQLAEGARARAAASVDAPPPTTKRHLDQDDIDALFGQ